MKRIFILFFLVFFLIGCGNKLTREKAENVLKKQPIVLQKSIPLRYGKDNIDSAQMFALDLHALEDAGYIDVKPVLDSDGLGMSLDVTIKPQAENDEIYKNGNKLVVILEKQDFVKVTGIRKISPTQSIVEYVSRNKVTRPGEILRVSQSPEENDVLFQLYDDGWRISLKNTPQADREVAANHNEITHSNQEMDDSGTRDISGQYEASFDMTSFGSNPNFDFGMLKVKVLDNKRIEFDLETSAGNQYATHLSGVAIMEGNTAIFKDGDGGKLFIEFEKDLAIVKNGDATFKATRPATGGSLVDGTYHKKR